MDLAEGDKEVLVIDGRWRDQPQVTGKQGNECRALHGVSVWSSRYEMAIALRQVDEKSNEIEIVAIPELLESVNAAGAIVTDNAMDCQKNIAWLIRDQHAEIGEERSNPSTSLRPQ